MRETQGQAQAEHEPVLLEAVIEALCRVEQGSFIDATFGRGGHTRAILAHLPPDARLLVLDRDPSAIAAAQALAGTDARVVVRQARFSQLADIATAIGLSDVVGILLDLGVSSPQLDDAARGFSFRVDAPLDMRMDPQSSPSAAQWLAHTPAAEMERVFKEYGEERFARAIARGIVHRRTDAPIESTWQLVDVIESNQSRKDPFKHAATRVFQAIRIEINQEFEELEQGLAAALELLVPGGRLAVISFHSLEDRIVKQTFKRWSTGPVVPRRMPVRELPKPLANVIGKPRRASHAEIARNPRARSAVLRVIEKVAERAA